MTKSNKVIKAVSHFTDYVCGIKETFRPAKEQIEVKQEVPAPRQVKMFDQHKRNIIVIPRPNQN